MRSKAIASCILATAVLAKAQLIPFFDKPSQKAAIAAADRMHQQEVMDMPGIQLPNTGDNKPPVPPDGPAKGDVILSDVMGSQRQINVFASFARDIDSVSKRLDTSSQNTTVLAPLNSAISGLPRKPWEDPKDYDTLGADAYDGQEGEDRAHRNLRRFAEAHIVPTSPWREGEKMKTLGGSEVWWERKDGNSYIQPGNVLIDAIVSRVANGEVWVLKGVMNYS